MKAPAPGPMTLGRLCADLGPELIEIASAPRGMDVPIGRVWLHDPREPVRREQAAGGLLLLPGADPASSSAQARLREIASAEVRVLAARAAAGWPPQLLAAAEALELALLSVPAEVCWGELYELARAAVLQGSSGPALGAGPEIPGASDLSGTAEALAAITGGAVTIDDMRSRILAFSAGERVDEMRASAILNRQVPDQWLREMRRHDVIGRLLASEEVIRVEIGDLKPRRAIAIRAGNSVVGSIWLAGEDRELAADADDALRRAARVAALQLTRDRVSRDLERRLRETALAALLGGGEASAAALAQAQARAGERLVVIEMQVRRRGASAPISAVSRLVDLVTTHLESYDRQPVLATSLDPVVLPPERAEERIYVLTGTGGGKDRSALLRILAECVERAAKTLDLELRVGLGHEVSAPAELGLARRSAEDCLALASPAQSVVDFDEVRDAALLADVDRLVADWRAEPSVAFAALVGHDEEHGTEYVRTLRCLFDAFGNASLVAEGLHLHPNTVRYRLRRITEITGIELRGEARLALELTLRAQPRLR